MRWGSERAGILAAVIGGLGAYCPDARGQGAVEPSYGRIDGDVTIVVGAGGVVTPGGPRATGELRARYLETMGLFATYEDSLPSGPTPILVASWRPGSSCGRSFSIGGCAGSKRTAPAGISRLTPLGSNWA